MMPCCTLCQRVLLGTTPHSKCKTFTGPEFCFYPLACKVGGIRRIVVPVELGYPDNDYKKQGPKPSTFAVSRRQLQQARVPSRPRMQLYAGGNCMVVPKRHSWEIQRLTSASSCQYRAAILLCRLQAAASPGVLQFCVTPSHDTGRD